MIFIAYTHTGILGYHTLILDITVFITSVILAFGLIYKLARSYKAVSYTPLVCIFIFIVTIYFLIFTYCPPQPGLFQKETFVFVRNYNAKPKL